jgi:hypothetical protein
MIKKMLAVFTSIVAGLAVVGVAWAGGDDGTSTSVTAGTEAAADVSIDDSSSSTEATLASSTSATVDASTSTSVEDDNQSSTSTSIAATSSTSAAGSTSTSTDSSTTSTTTDSTTSTSVDDNDRNQVPDGITTHTIPRVGTVTIEVFAGQLFLVSVSAPGWSVEHDKIESDRIELEFTNELDAEAEFEARINDGRVEVRIEVDSD